ncbi:MAG: hypothetical protein ABJD97_05900 [Betaproteobacteria bacterium]
MTFKLSTPLLATLAIAASFASLNASAADLPGKHPAYLHALTDLRNARWNLEHRGGDKTVSAMEDKAILEVDRAIAEARKAAHEDEKNTADHPHEDANLDHPGRLHHALDLLRAAHADIGQEEDNPEARAMRHSVEVHIVEAINNTERAIKDVELKR